MSTTRFFDHLPSGDHASRPAAAAVPEGTLYSCSDHDLIYQSDGSVWSTWATVGGGGGGGGVTDHGDLTGLADDDHIQYFTETRHDADDHSALQIVEAQITDLDHTDVDAVHVDQAAEIAVVTEKATPVSADLLLIEDSEAANVKKRVQVGNLPGGGGGGVTDHGALTGLADDDHSQYLDTTRHAAVDAADHGSGAATDGQVLTADGAGGAAWEDATGGGASDLDGLTDVTLTTPVLGQVLKFDGTAWVNDTDDVGSGSLPTPSAKGDIAVYDGTAWVVVSSGADDQVLTADSAQPAGVKWATPSGGDGSSVVASGQDSFSTTTVDVYERTIDLSPFGIITACKDLVVHLRVHERADGSQLGAGADVWVVAEAWFLRDANDNDDTQPPDDLRYRVYRVVGSGSYTMFVNWMLVA